MAKTKRIGKGRNAFSVLQSDYDSGFPSGVYTITNLRTNKESKFSASGLRKEIARIESIKEVKQTKKVKKNVKD